MVDKKENRAMAEKLFHHLLEYIESEGLDYYKKFTVKELGEICDIYRKGNNVIAGTYNNGMITMISSQINKSNSVERDYFRYVNEGKEKEISKESSNGGRSWTKYNNEELYLSEKYINSKTDYISKEIKKAGSNEKDFIRFVNDKGIIKLENKKVFGKKENTNISVDNYFEFNGKRVYVEIDSGNMAKLLAGQYTLLHSLSEENEDAVFLVIHYYKGYNAERTNKNLEYIREHIFNSKGMKYVAVHIDDFKKHFSEKNLIKMLS